MCIRDRVERGQRLTGRDPLDLRPHEHIERDHDGNPEEKTAPDRTRADLQPLQDPAAEILERQDVASPGAEEAAEDGGRNDRECHEDEPRGQNPQLERVHDLVKLEGRKSFPRESPVKDVNGDENVDRPKSYRAPPCVPRARGTFACEAHGIRWLDETTGHGITYLSIGN